MQPTPLKALALQALQCNQPCNRPATLELHHPEIQAVPETSVATHSQPNNTTIQEEHSTLQEIVRITVEQGHALHKCDTPEQAKRWAQHLQKHLPPYFDAFVIRNCEVNTYKWSTPESRRLEYSD